jgi:hypothetical protein
MNRTIVSRMGWSVLIALALAFSGCEDKPKFDPGLQYSAETLVQEFLHEYGELKTTNGSAIRSELPKQRPEDTTKAATKGEAPATKKAPVASLDELIAETIRKAAFVVGTSKAEACKKVSEEAQKTATIPDVDKKIIAEKLGNLSN